MFFLKVFFFKINVTCVYILLSTLRHFEAICICLFISLSLVVSLGTVIIRHWRSCSGNGLCLLYLFLTDTLSHIQIVQNTIMKLQLTYTPQMTSWTAAKSVSETDQHLTYHWEIHPNNQFGKEECFERHTTFYSMQYVYGAQTVNFLHAWNMVDLLHLLKCSAQKKTSTMQCSHLHVPVSVCQINQKRHQP